MSGRDVSDGYTSYDGIGRERLSLRAWRVMVRELLDYWELIRRLVIRNIAGQFRQSFLGYVWIMLPPIATTVVFSVLQKARVVNIQMPEGAMPYAIFALLGMTVWGYFTQLTMMATTSISNAGGLVSKIYFPREVLVLSAVGNAIVNFLIRLVVVVLTFLLLQYAPHWQIVYYVFLLIPFTLLGIGLGLLLAPINTMMNDVGRLMEFAFQFGMFLAPTVYPTPDIATASDTWQSLLFWAHQLNPVSHYLYAAHELVQSGTLTFGPGLQASVILSVLVFFVGWRFFHAIEPLLAERV
mgnify:FL=1